MTASEPLDPADVLADLVAEHVELDEQVIEIDAQTWAIHGRIAYDGEVIAATFASERDAWLALTWVRTASVSPASSSCRATGSPTFPQFG